MYSGDIFINEVLVAHPLKILFARSLSLLIYTYVLNYVPYPNHLNDLVT
jgi:hypothetical protein